MEKTITTPQTNLNRVELRGVIGSARTTTVGESRLVHFTVATNYAYKDREGCAVIETTWHNCAVWEGKRTPGEQLDRVVKGAKVHLFGRIRNNRYIAEDGSERTCPEIIVSDLEVIGPETPMNFEA